MTQHRDESSTREVAIGDLHFRVIRSPRVDAARTYLLVHGIGMSHRYLRRLHTSLAPDHDVLSIDLPGFGGLPKPVEQLDVPAMAAAIAALLDRLDLAPIVAVGHSMGSQWVIELAVQRPDLVSHVVVMGPVVDDRHRTPGAQARALAIDVFRESPRANGMVFSDYLRCGIRWYLRQLRHMLAYRTEDRARLLTRPLLVVRGSRDPVAGAEWCRRLAEAAPDAALLEIPGSPHVVQDTAPRIVADAIVAFSGSRNAR
ncbi:alpha/beta fold hydrolase [Microbacterium oleivorans]|uniref:alpha/beta fold hydrolase n=1 Tax=Microbacterium oleivorans TaxID=273677 RepID=UPI00204244D5|nr:alpha/beta hydrolase [Microbacterium oleivorans]MCM3695621.1 alpha/beta hydrolase [Microbacterium oleivorans]